MPHRYKVREIAQQSGLSEATVDRVLNERPGVRENTRAEVMQAIADLDKQRAQLRLNGRRYLIDVVMQTPQRFSDAFRAAVEAELPAFAPAMLRARFHLWESGSTAQMVDALERHPRQPRRGAQGRRTNPRSPRPSTGWSSAGVPVVTYATDVPASSRCGYVGIDNHGAGVTAAYLMNQWLGSAPSDVLITLSRDGVPRRGGARGRIPLGAARLGPRDRRSQRQRRHRRDQRAAGARGARAAPGRRGRLLGRRRQHRHRRGVREARTGLQGLHRPRSRRRQPTAAARRPYLGRCCTTICAPTRGWRCG